MMGKFIDDDKCDCYVAIQKFYFWLMDLPLLDLTRKGNSLHAESLLISIRSDNTSDWNIFLIALAVFTLFYMVVPWLLNALDFKEYLNLYSSNAKLKQTAISRFLFSCSLKSPIIGLIAALLWGWAMTFITQLPCHKHKWCFWGRRKVLGFVVMI